MKFIVQLTVIATAALFLASCAVQSGSASGALMQKRTNMNSQQQSSGEGK